MSVSRSFELINPPAINILAVFLRYFPAFEEGDGWAEKIVGEHDLLYFTLRRLEFEKRIEDDTCGKFHVLTLVDGERIRIRSVAQPERYFDAEYMDMVVVPADMGRYVIENLRTEPICVHKTMLKDGFDKE